MGQTPIYEQLRGERLIADVPATGDDPQRGDHHPGKHHLLTAAPVPAAVSRPPGPGTDRAANQHHRTYPADQPAGNGSPTAVAGTASSPALDSPRATSTGARHEQPPEPPAASHHPAAQGAAAGARGTHRAEGRGPRQLHHADPRPAAPA
ncbi:MAG: hypothetical protein WB735_06285, partial [Pseudonocardiaceae bacterium]